MLVVNLCLEIGTSFLFKEIKMSTDRHARIERNCEQCGNLFTARVERVNNGQGRFCSLICANKYQFQENSKSWGYKNGKMYWIKNRWIIHWKDENGKQHNTSYPRWWWTLNVGEIPDGYGISYKDEDETNIDPSNFCMMTLSDISKRNGGKSLGKPRPDIAGKNSKWWRNADREYPFEFSKRLKKSIKRRDKYICQCCYSEFESRGLDVHHVDRNIHNNDDKNLITVCKSCHRAIHGTERKSNDKIKYFQSLLLELIGDK
jgi:hypothetical protein